MEKTFEMKVDTLDADTVTLIPNPRYGATGGSGATQVHGDNVDFTSIVIEYGSARDEILFPVDDAEYTITIRRK